MPDTVGLVRTVARVLGVVVLLAGFPVVHLATRKRYRHLHCRYARAVLRCCGVRLRVIHRGGDEDAGGGVLVVSGHVGWTDALVLAALHPMDFVARGDLIDWPLLGSLARRLRVIPIDRERLRQLPEVIASVRQRLARGERVGVFPEGTTWCGRAHGRLRPAMFQAAVDAGVPVRPIRLRYTGRDGACSTVPGFVGADTLADSARRVLRSRGLVAEAVLLPLERPGSDRHALARRCERALRGDAALGLGVLGAEAPGVGALDVGVLDPDPHSTAIGTGPTRAIVADRTRSHGAPESAIGSGRAAVRSRSVRDAT